MAPVLCRIDAAHIRNLFSVGYVAGRHHECLRPCTCGGDLIPHRLEPLLAPATQNQTCPSPPQQQCQLATDATAGTGDCDDGVAILDCHLVSR